MNALFQVLLYCPKNGAPCCHATVHENCACNPPSPSGVQSKNTLTLFISHAAGAATCQRYLMWGQSSTPFQSATTLSPRQHPAGQLGCGEFNTVVSGTSAKARTPICDVLFVQQSQTIFSLSDSDDVDESEELDELLEDEESQHGLLGLKMKMLHGFIGSSCRQFARLRAVRLIGHPDAPIVIPPCANPAAGRNGGLNRAGVHRFVFFRVLPIR